MRPVGAFLTLARFELKRGSEELVREMTLVDNRTGLALCDRYLAQWNDGSAEAKQIVELRTSYKAALGENEEEEDDCDEDVFKGGD